MKKLWVALSVLVWLVSAGLAKADDAVASPEGTAVVQAFFAAFSKGDMPAVLALFHPEARLIAVRDVPESADALYGTYSGREGVSRFFTKLGATFDTQAFTVEQVTGDAQQGFASGHFTHRVKQSNGLYHSAWALRCELVDGLIKTYQFYEDSATLVQAAQQR